MADFVPRSVGRLGVPPHAEVGRDMPLHEVGIGLATYAVGTVSGVRLLAVLVQDPRGGRTPDVPCGPSAGVLVLLPITVAVAELSAADRFGSSVHVLGRRGPARTRGKPGPWRRPVHYVFHRDSKALGAKGSPGTIVRRPSSPQIRFVQRSKAISAHATARSPRRRGSLEACASL